MTFSLTASQKSLVEQMDDLVVKITKASKKKKFQNRTSKELKKLEKLLETQEALYLPYTIKNKHFITASKLKDFQICSLKYQRKYVDLEDSGIEEDETHFRIGSALDSWLTESKTYFEETSPTVSRRSGENPNELTRGDSQKVYQMAEEFFANKGMNHKPKKRIFIFVREGLLFKAELDDGSQIESDQLFTDIKTTANILTFSPLKFGYPLSMTFYQMAIEERTGILCEGRFSAMDKNPSFSRSKSYILPAEDLQFYRENVLLPLLKDAVLTQKSNLFYPCKNWETCCDCEYYTLCPHSRQTEPEIFSLT